MNLEQKEGWIWLDGEFIPWQDAKIHVLTHSLHYGNGVFEGVRAYQTASGPKLFRATDHTKRLLNSAKILQIHEPFSLQELIEAQREAVFRNNLHNAYLRPLVFSGAEGLGLHAKNLTTHVMIAAWDWGSYLGGETLKRGIRIKVSSFTRYSAGSTISKAKATGNYLNSVLAVREASRLGYDEALLLDSLGFVAEGSGENFFIIRNGELHTPDSACILEGITRDTVMQIARDLGLKVRERRISRDEIYIADEAFFTGTAAEVLPIVNIDDIEIGGGLPGPITRQIQQRFFEIVTGKNPNYLEWLE